MPTRTDPRSRLSADCGNCFGLCCVVLTFTRSADFAIDKPAGEACPNLSDDHRCTIHSQLRTKGFPGCTVYDCFGAGQELSKRGPEMFAALPILRQLHELLWYLTEALEYNANAQPAIDHVEGVSRTPNLADVDVAAERAAVKRELHRPRAIDLCATLNAEGASGHQRVPVAIEVASADSLGEGGTELAAPAPAAMPA